MKRETITTEELKNYLESELKDIKDKYELDTFVPVLDLLSSLGYEKADDIVKRLQLNGVKYFIQDLLKQMEEWK
jgi:hypothetical protein